MLMLGAFHLDVGCLDLASHHPMRQPIIAIADKTAPE
jgi:hypothetical protein